MMDGKFSGRADEIENLAISLLDLSKRIRKSPTAETEHRLFWPEGQKSMIDTLTRVIALRERRSNVLDMSLFGEPAWDMLLALYRANLTQTGLGVEHLCRTSGPFESTARRWLDILVTRGFVEVTDDEQSGGQDLAYLTEHGLVEMTKLFIDMPQPQAS